MWKPIVELKNTEKGKDIYVLGSGKSLDFVSRSFFENKTTIGIGNMYRYTPCKYYVTKNNRFLERRIGEHSGIQIVAKYHNGNVSGRIENCVPSDKPYYYFEHKQNNHKIRLEELDSDRIMVSWGTVNSAMHLAYYFGAKNIILAGCDCGAVDGELNFKGYRHKNEAAPPKSMHWYGKWLKDIIKDIVTLANELRRRGVPVVSLNPFVTFHLEGHTYQ